MEGEEGEEVEEVKGEEDSTVRSGARGHTS